MSAREEGLLVLALWLSVFTITARQGSDTPDVFMWLMVLLVQSIPYAASVLMAIISGFSRLPGQMIHKMTAAPAIVPPAGSPESSPESR